MYDSSHVRVNQADKAIVAGFREVHGKTLPRRQRRRAHALSAIETRATGRVPRTTNREIGIRLTGYQEGHRMNLAAARGPGDVVALVDPKLVGKKGDGQIAHILALTAQHRFPVLLG